MSHPTPEIMSFLRAIKEHPEDDAHRLIFADFLEETGEAVLTNGAHNIRAQVQGRVKDAYWNAHYFVEHNDWSIEPWSTRLLSSVQCSLQWWLDRAVELEPYHPITRVAFTDGHPGDWVAEAGNCIDDSRYSLAPLPHGGLPVFKWDEVAAMIILLQRKYCNYPAIYPINVGTALLKLTWPKILFQLPHQPPRSDLWF